MCRYQPYTMSWPCADISLTPCPDHVQISALHHVLTMCRYQPDALPWSCCVYISLLGTLPQPCSARSPARLRHRGLFNLNGFISVKWQQRQAELHWLKCRPEIPTQIFRAATVVLLTLWTKLKLFYSAYMSACTASNRLSAVNNSHVEKAKSGHVPISIAIFLRRLWLLFQQDSHLALSLDSVSPLPSTQPPSPSFSTWTPLLLHDVVWIPSSGQRRSPRDVEQDHCQGLWAWPSPSFSAH